MATPGPLTGQKLGDKYLLGNLLGQGGFGVVYQAQHLLLDRPQAIKILLEQHFASPKFRERFLREARTLAALDHGNILPVHDVGIEGARAYLVMPYIAGGTLESMLRGWTGPVGLGAVQRILEQIASALDYAHARNIAHLDLKPANLLVHEDGRLLLSDFGLAHLMEQGAVEGGTSLQFGTPSYMAPEHLQGRPDKCSDVYALGVILYQMLAGRVPFEGSTPAMIMMKHLNEPPPPLRSVRPDLPPALESLLAKALAKDPAARYTTAGEMVADFKVATEGQVSGPYGVGRGSAIFSDPTIRVGPASGPLSDPLMQELAELKEAVKRLSQGIPGQMSGPVGASAWGGAQPTASEAYVATPAGKTKQPSLKTPRGAGAEKAAKESAVSKGSLWTQDFVGIFIALAATGGIVSIFTLNGVFPAARLPLILTFVGIVLVGITLAGVYYTRSLTLLACSLLLLIVVITNILLVKAFSASSAFLSVPHYYDYDDTIYSTTPATVIHHHQLDFVSHTPSTTYLSYTLVITLVFTVAAIWLSYAVARWKSSLLTGFILFPAIVSAGMGLYVLGDIPADARNIVLMVAVLICAAFTPLLLLLRPKGWRQHAGIILFLLFGALIFAFSKIAVLPEIVNSSVLDHLFSYGLPLTSYVLFILALLLLVQTERVQKKAQEVARVAV